MELKRNIDPVVLAEYAKPVFYPVALVYIDAPDDELFLHSGVGEILFDGHVWLGLGEIGSLQIPFEASGAVPEEAVIGLSGPVEVLLSEADDQRIRGRQVDIYAGCTTAPGGNVLIGVPHRPFTGSMSKPEFSLSSDRKTASLTVTVKSGQPARSGAQISHSDEGQQVLFAGDSLFRRVSNAAKWARTPPQWPAS